jgi:simple sugar transport system ATP-binding protein
VDGNGQLELAEALVGIRPVSGGTLETEQRPAYIPQDRHRDGLALGMSVQDNLLVEGHRLPALRRFGLFLAGAVRAWCETLVAKFQIKTSGLDQPAASLSGGNQQKIVVARALASEPAAIVAMDPTRGLDVQATAYVHRTLLDASRQGAAIVLFSTDLDELAALAGRSAFMSGGRLREGGDVAEMIGGRS